MNFPLPASGRGLGLTRAFPHNVKSQPENKGFGYFLRKSYIYTSKSGNSLISELNLKTDILVTSGESSATWAAWNAAAQGVKVVLVDKSYCGMSGVTVFFGTDVWYVLHNPQQQQALGGFL